MDQEIKKQVLIDFSHRCSVCGKVCPFEEAQLISWNQIDHPKAKDLICLCSECFDRVNRENWDRDALSKYRHPRKNKISNIDSNALLPKTLVVIVLKPEVEILPKKDQEFLQSALSAFLNIDQEIIQIKSAKNLPLEINIELPTANAEVILKSFDDQQPQLYQFLFPIPFSAIKRKNVEMRWLSDDELITFRKDYRELENEVQNFFRAYYLSGLILVAAWLIGQSKPLLELSIGNGGYNIYAILGIALLNMIATTYLLHKSIVIHEISQFITYLSKPDSVFNYWESWRRSRQNYGRRASRPYYFLITILPFSVSFLILSHVCYVLSTDPQILLSKIKEHQIPQVSVINNPSKSVEYESMPDLERKKLSAIEERLKQEQSEYVCRVKPVLTYAWILFIIVCVAHGIPVLLVLINSYKQKKKWDELNKLRGWDFLFQNLNINPATIDEIDSNKTEFITYTKDLDKFTSELTQNELKLFIERIKEEANKKS